MVGLRLKMWYNKSMGIAIATRQGGYSGHLPHNLKPKTLPEVLGHDIQDM